MRIIIEDSELENASDLNALYGDLLSINQGDTRTGTYTDVSGSRINIGGMSAPEAIRMIAIVETYQPR